MSDSMSERDKFYNDALDFAFESGLSREEAYAFADEQRSLQDSKTRRRRRAGSGPSARIRHRMAQSQPSGGGGGGGGAAQGGLTYDMTQGLAADPSFDMAANLEPVADTGQGGQGITLDDDAPVPDEAEPQVDPSAGFRGRLARYADTSGLRRLRQQQAEGYDDMQGLLRQQHEDIQEGQKKLGDMYSEAADVYRKQQAGMQMLQKANSEARERARANIKSVEDSISNFKIDPNRAFPTLGGRILAAVSVAVGAFAQGLSGGKLPNTALQIIMDAVNKDIDAQKHDFQTKKTVLQNKNNVYAQLLNTHGHEEKARQLAMNGALHHATMRIQQVSNTIAGQKGQQAIQRLLQQIQNAKTNNALANVQTEKDIHHKALMLEMNLGKRSAKQGQTADRMMSLFKKADNLISVQLRNSLKAHNEDKRDPIKALAQRAAGEALMPISKFAGYKTYSKNHQAISIGNVKLAQTLMKAFQGGNPSNHDAKTFVQIIPPVALEHSEREAVYLMLREFLDEQTKGGTQPIPRGALGAAGAAGQFGKLEEVSPAQVQLFIKEADIKVAE